MLFPILLIVVMFICVSMMWNEGMWSNALTLVNVLFASMVATNYYEPMADYFDGQLPGWTYTWDLLSMWLLFWLSFSVFRASTDAVSKHSVRFKMPVEQTGRVLFALATAWILVCFVTTSIHMAPLARSSFRGSFQGKGPLSNNFFGLAPDRIWLGFIHSRSAEGGPLARSSPRPFDPEGEFILKYGARRQALFEHNAEKGTIGVKKR